MIFWMGFYPKTFFTKMDVSVASFIEQVKGPGSAVGVGLVSTPKAGSLQ